MRTYAFTELKVGDRFTVSPTTVVGRKRDLLEGVLLEKVSDYEAHLCLDGRSLTGLVGCADIRFYKVRA